MELFNAEEYFKNIATTNKLCIDEGFHFCTCSGLENLEDAIDLFRKVSNFFIFDDTTEGQDFRGAEGTSSSFYLRPPPLAQGPSRY